MTALQTLRTLHIYLRRDGLRGVASKINRKFHTRYIARYPHWFRTHAADGSTLQKQAETTFDTPLLLSIIIPVYQTEPRFLRALGQSLLAQSYPQWEACLYDGGSTRTDTRETLAALAAADARFHVTYGMENCGISGNTNQAIAQASGAYLLFCDHDDLLAPEALFAYRVRIDQTGADLLYCDEDKLNRTGTRLFDPHLKPDFSIDMLRQSNYICHMTAIKRTLLDTIGGFDPAFDGSQDYDLVLRASEKAIRIEHIAKVLYHWRMLGASMSHQDSQKCLLASQRAVQAHLQRCGLDGTVALHPPYVFTQYALPADAGATLIWVERQAAQHTEALQALLDTATGIRLRAVVARMKGTPDGAAFPTIIAAPNEPLPALLNRAVALADTPWVIVLDSALQPQSPQWAALLLMHAQRQDVGFATSAVYNRRNRLACAGYAVGNRRIARGRHHGLRRGDDGYFRCAGITQNVSAVPWCCCAFRKAIWAAHSGWDCAFQTHLFDVDLCLRMCGHDLVHVYVPQAEVRCTGSGRPWYQKGDAVADEALLLQRYTPLEDPWYNPQWDADTANETLK